MVIIVFTLCIGSLVFVMDRTCIGALAWRIPVYPNATQVEQQYTMFGPNGTGKTVTVYYTTDAQSQVESWYGREVGRRSIDASKDSNLANYYQFTGLNWIVDADKDGKGTDIVIVASCFSR